jgi:hypothetical protein
MRRSSLLGFLLLAGTLIAAIPARVQASPDEPGFSGSLVQQSIALRAAGVDGRDLFDRLAAHNVARGQFALSGSVDSTVIAAIAVQLRMLDELDQESALRAQYDTLARLAARLQPLDAAIPLQTIALESDLGMRRLTSRAADRSSSLLGSGLSEYQSAHLAPETYHMAATPVSATATAEIPGLAPLASPSSPPDTARTYGALPATSSTATDREATVARSITAAEGFGGPAAMHAGPFVAGFVPRPTAAELDRYVAPQILPDLAFAVDQPLTGNRTLDAAAVTAAGLVSPGNSPGKINISGDFNLLNTSILLIELAGTPSGVAYDIINVSGNVTLGGARLDLQLLDNFQAHVQPSDTFAVVLAGTGGTGGQLSGTFGNIANGQRLVTLDGLGSFQVNYGPNSIFSPNSVVLSSFAAVPEPSTWVLMTGGALAMVFVLRRRKA